MFPLPNFRKVQKIFHGAGRWVNLYFLFEIECQVTTFFLDVLCNFLFCGGGETVIG